MPNLFLCVVYIFNNNNEVSIYLNNFILSFIVGLSRLHFSPVLEFQTANIESGNVL